jgi:hypothetical protein
MQHARIDITQGLDGEPVVLACFDLSEEEIAASAHAVKAICGDRFRNTSMSIDDVLELRELMALADELGDHVLQPGARTLVMRPSRLAACRDVLSHFVESRDAAEWARADDCAALPMVRSLAWPLEELCAEAMRAALAAPAPRAC